MTPSGGIAASASALRRRHSSSCRTESGGLNSATVTRRTHRPYATYATASGGSSSDITDNRFQACICGGSSGSARVDGAVATTAPLPSAVHYTARTVLRVGSDRIAGRGSTGLGTVAIRYG